MVVGLPFEVREAGGMEDQTKNPWFVRQGDKPQCYGSETDMVGI